MITISIKKTSFLIASCLLLFTSYHTSRAADSEQAPEQAADGPILAIQPQIEYQQRQDIKIMHPSRDVDGKDCRVLFEGTNFQIDHFFINGHLPGSSPFDIWNLARDAYKDLVKPISRAKLKTSIPYDQIAKELQSKTYEILGDGFHQLPATEFRHQNFDAHRLKAINPEGLDFDKFLAETSKELWQKDQPVGRGILKIGVDGHPVLAFEYYVDNQYIFQRQSICLLTSVV